jgi:anaerobic C4-dicarboxylate transporter
LCRSKQRPSSCKEEEDLVVTIQSKASIGRLNQSKERTIAKERSYQINVANTKRYDHRKQTNKQDTIVTSKQNTTILVIVIVIIVIVIGTTKEASTSNDRL